MGKVILTNEYAKKRIEEEKQKKAANKVTNIEEGKDKSKKNKDYLEKALSKLIKVPELRSKKILLNYAITVNENELDNYYTRENLNKVVSGMLGSFILPSYLTEKGKLIPYELAKTLTRKENYIADKVSLYKYNGQYYEETESLYNKIDFYITDKTNMIERNIKEVTYSLMQQVARPEVKQDRGYINFKNGIYDIENNKLIPHSPDIITLGTVNANYKEELKSIKGTKFESFIISSLGEDFIDVIQELVGVCLYPVTDKVNYFYMLIGQGRNGKGVLLEILSHLVPECLRSSLPIGGYDMKFANASIKGKQLNIAADDQTTRLEAIGNFKTVTANEEIQVEKKGKDAIIIKPLLTHISAFNVAPSMQEKANAFWDRAIIMHFENTFGTVEEVERGEKMYIRDIDLKKDLLKELDIIVSWGLEGLKRLKANRYSFTKNKKMLEALEEERLKTDTVRTWMKERITKVKNIKNAQYKKETYLYSLYSNWCYTEGYKPVTGGTFRDILKVELKDCFKKINNSKSYSVEVIVSVDEAKLLN